MFFILNIRALSHLRGKAKLTRFFVFTDTIMLLKHFIPHRFARVDRSLTVPVQQ